MTGNVVEIGSRLRDGRAVRTEEDFRQWVYEYLDRFSNEIGRDRTPIDVFPVWTRIMVEWCDATSCHGVDRRQRARRITSRMDCSGSGGQRARAAAIGASPRARQYWSRHSEASSSCPPERRNR
jgi:hypothetical protein